MAAEAEGLREVMYKMINKMIEDGELVPVYEGDRLVDVIVHEPADDSRNT